MIIYENIFYTPTFLRSVTMENAIDIKVERNRECYVLCKRTNH